MNEHILIFCLVLRTRIMCQCLYVRCYSLSYFFFFEGKLFWPHITFYSWSEKKVNIFCPNSICTKYFCGLFYFGLVAFSLIKKREVKKADDGSNCDGWKKRVQHNKSIHRYTRIIIVLCSMELTIPICNQNSCLVYFAYMENKTLNLISNAKSYYYTSERGYASSAVTMHKLCI